MANRIKHLVLLCISVALLLSCTDTSSPEEQVRQWLDNAEAAVENRDTSDLADLVSIDYVDDHDRDKQILTRMAAGYFLSHQKIYLFTRILSVDFPKPSLADLRIAAAVAGTPVNAATLASVRGSVYQLELRLRKEDDGWQLTQARWQRAGLEAFGQE